MLKSKNHQRSYLIVTMLLTIFQFYGQMIKAENTTLACENFKVSVITPTLPENVAPDCENHNQYSASIQGGVAPFQYDWLSDGRYTDPILKHTSANYPNRVLTITDANGCVARDTFNIRSFESPRATLTYTITESTITFHLENSIHVADYTVHTTDFPDFKGIDYPHPLPTSGVYSLALNVTNPCGKTYVKNDNIIVNGSCENLSLSLSGIYPYSLYADARGGTPPYTYTSSDARHVGGNIFLINCGGTFEVTVTDAKGCTVTETASVSFYADADITYNIKNSKVHFGLENESAPITDFKWSTTIPGGNTYGTAALPPVGTYQICVKLYNNCTDGRTVCRNIQITQADIDANAATSCENLVLELTTQFGGSNFIMAAKGIGGAPPYTFTTNAPEIAENVFDVGCVRNKTLYGTVTDANGCTATDTLFNVNTYPKGDIEYTISNDTVHFSFENEEHVNFISHWTTNIPGGILAGTKNSAALPPTGRYQICAGAAGFCSDKSICKWVEIEGKEPEQPSCKNGIEQDVYLRSQAQIDKFEEYYSCNDCTTINGNLLINGTDITDLSGLSFLTAIKGDLVVQQCATLTTLQGLENITQITGHLKIKQLPLLTNLEGINGRALKSIGKNISIRTNENLQDISSLRGIKSIGKHLFINKNPLLTNLSGLEQLANIAGNLLIEDNDRLSDGAALCHLFTQGSIEGILTMSGNKAGCNNPTQILKACNAYPSNCEEKADFTAIITNNSVILVANTSTGNNGGFLWKLEDGVFALTRKARIDYTFPLSGAYKINLKAIGSCVASMSRTIEISAKTQSENTRALCQDGIDNDGDGLVDGADLKDCKCLLGLDLKPKFDFAIADNVIDVVNTSTGEIASAQWSSPYPIIGNQITLPTTSGSITVCIEVGNGCEQTRQFCQTISTGSACDEFSQPIVTQSRMSSTQETTKADLVQTLGTARPNPTTDRVTIDFDLPKASKVTLQLFSLSGQRSAIYLNNVPFRSGKHQQEISLNQVPAGIYLMQFRTADAIWTEKIVKIEY